MKTTLDIGRISTSRLVQSARRTKALRVLYKNADITAKEFSTGKECIRIVLESHMSSPNGSTDTE